MNALLTIPLDRESSTACGMRLSAEEWAWLRFDGRVVPDCGDPAWVYLHVPFDRPDLEGAFYRVRCRWDLGAKVRIGGARMAVVKVAPELHEGAWRWLVWVEERHAVRTAERT